MPCKKTIAAIFAIIMALSPASAATASPANFKYYTLDLPDGWQPTGPHGAHIRTPDRTIYILPQGMTVLPGAKPNADGSPDMRAIADIVNDLKRDLPQERSKAGFPMIDNFVTKDLGDHRSVMRGVFRMNEQTIVVLYFVIGPTYIVPFSVSSQHSVDTTMAKIDPVMASLKWIGTGQ